MTADLHDGFERLLEVTRSSHRHSDFLRDAGFTGDGPTRGETFVLTEIIRGGPIRPSDLAASLGLDRSIVSRQIDNLVRAGFVARTPDPTDGRASLLEPTDRGRSASTRLREVRENWLTRVLTSLPPEDVTELGRLLPLLADAIDRAEIQPS